MRLRYPRVTGFFILFFLLSSCGSMAPRDSNEYMVGATLWHRTAAEYRALCYQGYQLATLRLKEALRRKPKHPAVVLDIDQTVLDVSEYQVRLFNKKRLYPFQWDQFTQEAANQAIPGAIDFIQFAQMNGVEVFFVTDRTEAEAPGTIANLKRVGVKNVGAESVLFRGKKGKLEHRKAIAESHDILLLVGDNLNDFDELYVNRSVKDRKMVTDQTREKFGKRFIIMPNAMFGAWEGAIYNYNWALTPHGRMEQRHSALESESSPKRN